MIVDNVLQLKKELNKTLHAYHRQNDEVRILAVCKGQPATKISAAINAGLTCFGENYLQEALPKLQELPQHLEWHFIGNIQRNKTKKIAENFSWVQSIASDDIAERLNHHRPSDLLPLNVCIEVNISHEITKHGAEIENIFKLAEYCQHCERLRLRGIMAIPAFKDNFADQRAQFAKLRELYESLRDKGFMLDTLSMGMSHDWQAAVAEGSTMIRIGTAIFGERN